MADGVAAKNERTGGPVVLQFYSADGGHATRCLAMSQEIKKGPTFSQLSHNVHCMVHCHCERLFLKIFHHCLLLCHFLCHSLRSLEKMILS